MAVQLDLFNTSLILIIFIITYVGIIHSKVDKTLAAVVGALVATIAIIKLEIPDAHHPDEHMTEEGLLHFQDLEIIGLIIGTLMLVDIAQESGVFHFLSIKILKMTEGDPKKLLRYLSALTVLLSALVNNISAMMIVGSLTLIACERLELDPKPYIITELSMTTVGGIITLISSVPNVIIAQTFGITFADFFIIGALWGFVLMFATLFVFEFLYRNDIAKPSEPELMAARVQEFDEWAAVRDRGLFKRSIIILTLTIMAFVFSAEMGVSLAMVAIAGGLTMVVSSGKKLEIVLRNLDWTLVAFFLGLFVLIAALDAVELLDFIAEKLADVLPQNQVIAAIILLWVTAFVSAIVDNIVVAAAFGPILYTVAHGSSNYSPALIAWAAIFGANFGGGITPIGAPSAVVGLSLLYRKTGEKISWGEFIKTQGVATLVRLSLTMFYLWALSFYL